MKKQIIGKKIKERDILDGKFVQETAPKVINILENGTTFLAANRPLVLYAELDNNHQYVSTVRHSLSIVEVANEDVNNMLHKKCGCCDAVWTCYRVATIPEVDMWRKPTD
jgi:hypothetical protein